MHAVGLPGGTERVQLTSTARSSLSSRWPVSVACTVGFWPSSPAQTTHATSTTANAIAAPMMSHRSRLRLVRVRP